MKTSTKIILASVFSLGVIGTVAAGRYAGHQCRFGHGGDFAQHSAEISERISKKLNLDENQQNQLDTLLSQIGELRLEMTNNRESKREALAELLAASRFDQEKALTLIREKTAAVETHAPQIVASIAAFSDGLNQEQKKQVQDMLEHRFSHGWGHWKQHGGQGGGR